jgi:hypothetical protein
MAGKRRYFADLRANRLSARRSTDRPATSQATAGRDNGGSPFGIQGPPSSAGQSRSSTAAPPAGKGERCVLGLPGLDSTKWYDGNHFDWRRDGRQPGDTAGLSGPAPI